MKFEGQISPDLSPEPGEGRRDSAQGEGFAVASIDRDEGGDQPEKDSEEQNLGHVGEYGKGHCHHGIEIARKTCDSDIGGKEDDDYAQGPRLAKLLAAAQSVDSAVVSAQALNEGLKGPAIGQRLDHAREAAISLALT